MVGLETPDVTGDNDCDDTNLANVYPGATEILDGFDNNCDSSEPLSLDETDTDGDHEIPSLDGDELTWAGDELVSSGGDCDDTVPKGQIQLS